MAYYKYKNDIDLTWMENKAQAQLVLKNLFRRVENEVLEDLKVEFVAAISRGELLRLTSQTQAVRELVALKTKSITQ